jgi:hypothetical protein
MVIALYGRFTTDFKLRERYDGDTEVVFHNNITNGTIIKSDTKWNFRAEMRSLFGTKARKRKNAAIISQSIFH